MGAKTECGMEHILVGIKLIGGGGSRNPSAKATRPTGGSETHLATSSPSLSGAATVPGGGPAELPQPGQSRWLGASNQPPGWSRPARVWMNPRRLNPSLRGL